MGKCCRIGITEKVKHCPGMSVSMCLAATSIQQSPCPQFGKQAAFCSQIRSLLANALPTWSSFPRAHPDISMAGATPSPFIRNVKSTVSTSRKPYPEGLQSPYCFKGSMQCIFSLFEMIEHFFLNTCLHLLPLITNYFYA